MEKVTHLNDFLLCWNMIIHIRFMTIFVAFELPVVGLNAKRAQKERVFVWPGFYARQYLFFWRTGVNPLFDNFQLFGGQVGKMSAGTLKLEQLAVS